MRIRWATQIAHALARVTFFGTTATLELCSLETMDFGAVYIKPNTLTSFIIGPPLLFPCPWLSYGEALMRHDNFAFGDMLFTLLFQTIPTSPRSKSRARISINDHHHENRNYDTHPASKYSFFVGIVDKCFI
jgi:hypothetical protein